MSEWCMCSSSVHVYEGFLSTSSSSTCCETSSTCQKTKCLLSRSYSLMPSSGWKTAVCLTMTRSRRSTTRWPSCEKTRTKTTEPELRVWRMKYTNGKRSIRMRNTSQSRCHVKNMSDVYKKKKRKRSRNKRSLTKRTQSSYQANLTSHWLAQMRTFMVRRKRRKSLVVLLANPKTLQSKRTKTGKLWMAKRKRNDWMEWAGQHRACILTRVWSARVPKGK